MTLNEDIIPVTYMSGTGGNFLSKFITMAKNNSKDYLQLSKHGNAHGLENTELSGSGIGPTQPKTEKSDDDLKIKKILSNTPKENTSPIYYPCDHIVDLERCMKFFKKSIRITLEQRDIQDVAFSYTGKFEIDHRENDKKTAMFNLKWHAFVYISQYAKHFTDNIQLPNVLYISWKELMYNDPIILINKLHNFTLIPKENFNVENLINWRKATISCIETISTAK